MSSAIVISNPTTNQLPTEMPTKMPFKSALCAAMPYPPPTDTDLCLTDLPDDAHRCIQSFLTLRSSTAYWSTCRRLHRMTRIIRTLHFAEFDSLNAAPDLNASHFSHIRHLDISIASMSATVLRNALQPSWTRLRSLHINLNSREITASQRNAAAIVEALPVQSPDQLHSLRIVGSFCSLLASHLLFGAQIICTSALRYLELRECKLRVLLPLLYEVDLSQLRSLHIGMVHTTPMRTTDALILHAEYERLKLRPTTRSLSDLRIAGPLVQQPKPNILNPIDHEDIFGVFCRAVGDALRVSCAEEKSLGVALLEPESITTEAMDHYVGDLCGAQRGLLQRFEVSSIWHRTNLVAIHRALKVGALEVLHLHFDLKVGLSEIRAMSETVLKALSAVRGTVRVTLYHKCECTLVVGAKGGIDAVQSLLWFMTEGVWRGEQSETSDELVLDVRHTVDKHSTRCRFHENYENGVSETLSELQSLMQTRSESNPLRVKLDYTQMQMQMPMTRY